MWIARLTAPAPVIVSSALPLLVSPAFAETINVDFGTADVPASSYAAAGESGVWNAVDVLPSAERAPLVDVDGNPAGQIYMIGGTDLLVSDDTSTSGDDASLIDDMLIGFNDPVDVCIWIENIENGRYEVLTYALTPSAPEATNRVRVDFADEGPIVIGGAWGGAHVEGVSYARHTVDVTDGVLALHSGEWGAEIQSGINGIQIAPAGTVSAPDLATAVTIKHVRPNPARSSQVLLLRGAIPPGETRVEIFGVTGRRVRALSASAAGGMLRLVWDGRDAAGRSVPAGRYWARVGGMPLTTSLVRVD